MYQRACRVQQSRRRQRRGGLHGVVVVEVGQQRRQSLREHRLAGAERAEQAEVVADTGRGDPAPTARAIPACRSARSRIGPSPGVRGRTGVRPGWLLDDAEVRPLDELSQRVDRGDLDAGNEAARMAAAASLTGLKVSVQR